MATETAPKVPILPGDDEIDEIILGPDSLSWKLFSDPRLFLGAGYALLMQVAHPTVGSGVRDHSNFSEEPWERLLRTTDYLFLISFGGREAAQVGRRVRELHKTIKGSNPDGSRYHALEPDAYAWVHATLIEAGMRAYRQFVRPLSRTEENRLIAEGVPLGRLVGVRPGDLPTDRDGFFDYFETMTHERLADNETVQLVLSTMAKPGPPPLPSLRRIWPLLRIPPAQGLRISTTGLLPAELRQRFGVRWARRQVAELRALSATSRGLTPLLPRRLKEGLPDFYLRWRREAIARGPLGPAADAAREHGIASAAIAA